MIYTSTEEVQMEERLQLIKAAKRVVIKIGSAVLTSGNGVNVEVIDNIAKDIKYLYDLGKEVILVSSGAVAAGRKKIQFPEENVITLKQKQALAAIGQSHLMHIYDSAFENHNINIAQVLLTHADLAHRSRYVNFKNTIFTLLNMGVVPIINENDTVSTEELQFGDNDNLGALVTNLIEGDLFICLTDVDCLYTANPQTDKDAQPVFIVSEIDEEVEQMAGNSKSILGTGGMQSKIAAAKKVAGGGGASVIGPGRLPGVIQKIFNGEMVGTYFKPYRKKLQGRKQWIAFVLNPKGVLEVDSGACRAICTGGKSLLPSGVTGVKGNFNTGDSVECHDKDGNVIAVGTVNYRSEDVLRIKGKHSDVIENILGYRDSDVLIHRDNLVILN
jgi:glutamate 5-kinase